MDGLERESKESAGEDVSSPGNEADVLDMDRFEALTKNSGGKAKGFGGRAK